LSVDAERETCSGILAPLLFSNRLFSSVHSKECCGLFSEEEDHIDEMDDDHRAVEGGEEG
jgi:hypothetical protein